jgi:hypothetical protein
VSATASEPKQLVPGPQFAWIPATRKAPIHLICDGKLWATESQIFAQPETNRSIIIDMENGRIGPVARSP